MKDIAALLGVSKTTVSKALRNHPEVSPARRDEICALAQKLGYVKSPALAALSAYRRKRAPVRYVETLAVLVAGSDRETWLRGKFNRFTVSSIQARAAGLGYNVEVFALPPVPERHAEVAAQLFHRGIRGVVCLPYPLRMCDIQIDWKGFVPVSLYRCGTSPFTHYVGIDQYRGARTAIAVLHRQGYRRIGLMLPRVVGEHSDYEWEAGIELSIRRQRGSATLPRYVWDKADFREFREWLRQARPDVVVNLGPEWVLTWIRKAGLRVPEEIGFCALDLDSADSPVAGLYQRRDLLGAAVVDLLHGLLIRNEMGLAPIPHAVELAPKWVSGTTLRTTT
jgi:LacI family transcriptional regulator